VISWAHLPQIHMTRGATFYCWVWSSTLSLLYRDSLTTISLVTSMEVVLLRKSSAMYTAPRGDHSRDFQAWNPTSPSHYHRMTGGNVVCKKPSLGELKLGQSQVTSSDSHGMSVECVLHLLEEAKHGLQRNGPRPILHMWGAPRASPAWPTPHCAGRGGRPRSSR